MRKRLLWPIAPLALFVVLAGVALAKRATPLEPKPESEPAPVATSEGSLVVHEWGTFLAMSGSDGVSLDGMYHEEHALPGFVHARSQDILRLPMALLKSETPVIYFYTDKAQDVTVHVNFRRGLWTQWYPQVTHTNPVVPKPGDPVAATNSYLSWSARVIPAAAGTPDPAPPETSSDSLWNHARQVDAAYVQTWDVLKIPKKRETERFLFYRGLGRAPLPLKFEAAAGGTLSLDRAGKHGVRHAFTLRVEGGKGAFAYHPALEPGQSVAGQIPSMDGARPLGEFVAKLGDELAARLVQSGLYAKEARAMVNTWSESYFRTEGVRTLFVMPQAWTDGFIPLTIYPKPKETVRVMVGRVELLTPERERLAEAAVRDLTSTDAVVQLRGFQTLRDQGRYVEPIVRRVLAATKDESTRKLCRKLLVTDFVTDLRPAPPMPAGAACDPISARAQLASLLGELKAEDKPKARP